MGKVHVGTHGTGWPGVACGSSLPFPFLNIPFIRRIGAYSVRHDFPPLQFLATTAACNRQQASTWVLPWISDSRVNGSKCSEFTVPDRTLRTRIIRMLACVIDAAASGRARPYDHTQAAHPTKSGCARRTVGGRSRLVLRSYFSTRLLSTAPVLFQYDHHRGSRTHPCSRRT